VAFPGYIIFYRNNKVLTWKNAIVCKDVVLKERTNVWSRVQLVSSWLYSHFLGYQKTWCYAGVIQYFTTMVSSQDNCTPAKRRGEQISSRRKVWASNSKVHRSHANRYSFFLYSSILIYFIGKVDDHRVLSNRSKAFFAVGNLTEALKDAERCCTVRPYWPKVCS